MPTSVGGAAVAYQWDRNGPVDDFAILIYVMKNGDSEVTLIKPSQQER
jgi:hypothetical protein